jgi:hypothetical protein
MLWLGDWEFCSRHGCHDESISIVRDCFSVHQWLLQAKDDAVVMQAMRMLLWETGIGAWDLSRVSDGGVLDVIADLLNSGRLHVHASPTSASFAGIPEGPTAGSSRADRADPVMPFPISERKRRARGPVVAFPEPVIESDPPTFAAETDFAAQAATLVAAANTGVAVCYI